MSLISSFIPSGITALPRSISSKSSISTGNLAPARSTNGGLVIECSSKPQKKATAHHRHSRPRKTQPWDMKRKPTVYAPLPPLPPDWSPVSGTEVSAEGAESGSAESAPALSE